MTKEKFEEKYKNEEFVLGAATDINGNQRTYKDLQTYPYFEGIIHAKNNESGVIGLITKSNS